MQSDSFIGKVINQHWTLQEKVGNGQIGTVYKAFRKNPDDVLACKIITKRLPDGWQKELEKVTKLKGVDSVVQYHSHGLDFDENMQPFTWILWNDFIDGINLKTYIEENPWPLDMAFIENIAEVIIKVLFACQAVDIIHGDLHPGNILIQNPDIKTIEKRRKIWISDFGYGGSHNSKTPKDDFRHLSSLTLTLLEKLSTADLNHRDRLMHEKLKFFFSKRFSEFDFTQGDYVRNLEKLFSEFKMLSTVALQETERAEKSSYSTEPGDYLWAEAIGNKAQEWKNLFVPEFLAAKDLLNKNITILTGARGCGKTMAFKRLTAYMDKIVGEPSGVPGADQFIGFYLNCRNLIEAFPWIPPDTLNHHISAQLIHFFHLSWLNEICNTLYVCFANKNIEFNWLTLFALKYFPKKFENLPNGADHLSHIMAFIENEKEICRLTRYGQRKDLEWELYKMDFLDDLHKQVIINIPWPDGKPFYFFLDDYTIPTIPRNVQRVLNPIVFKRRDGLFFKVSTESSISFERTSLRGKPLELHQDFELIDLASESLHQGAPEKKRLLEKIFKPRIARHEFLKNDDLSLEDVLGKSNKSSNDLAWEIRDNTNGKKKKILYYGIESFIGMWSSDIRIMIQMFVDILRKAHPQLEKGKKTIDPVIQNDIYRTTGGEFLVFAESVPAPSSLEKNFSLRKNMSFGSHLIKIVETFINISKYELSHGDLMPNQGRSNPKQAFRLEVIDKFDLNEDTKDYYEGLVRWHIFLHDWRGKSVRGMITPRLFLNRVLLPNAQLTFSGKDNIHLSNLEFNKLLRDPVIFQSYWIAKKKRNDKGGAGNQLQGKIFDI